MTQRTKCYLCEQRVPRKIGHIFGFDLRRCPSCRFISIRLNQPFTDMVAEYFDRKQVEGHWPYRKLISEPSEHLRNLATLSLIKKVKAHKSSGVLLNFGNDDNGFIKTANQLGFIAQGSEPFDSLLAQINNIEPKSFDVIVSTFFLCRVLDPRKTLKQLKTWLRPDGILVLQSVDINFFWPKLRGLGWSGFTPPQPMYYFSESTLLQLLDQAGFNMIRIQRSGRWQSLRVPLHRWSLRHQSFVGKLAINFAQSPIGLLPIYTDIGQVLTIFAKKKRQV